MRLAGALFLLAAASAPAAGDDITRTCFPAFCVEAREAFTAFNRQPGRGLYLLRVSRTQSEIYLQSGPEPVFPHCGAVCRVEEAEGEKRAFNTWTNRLVGRLVGPFEPCGGGGAFFVHVFVYNTEASPDWLEIVRECG